MILADTHAHIFFKDFNQDRDEIISKADSAGVKAVIDVGLDFKTNPLAVANSKKYPGVFAAAGFHPHDSKDFDPVKFTEFIEENESQIIAFGEFGLDYFHNFSPPDVQRKVFEKVLEICIPRGKPVIIHCRDAQSDVMKILSSAGKTSGVMHCFSGGLDFLEETLSIGFHISVGGPLTYPKNDMLREVVRKVPLKRLLFETDCPYLAPQHVRGKRNEPSYIPFAAEKTAQIRNVPVEKIAAATTMNAMDLFGEPLSAYLRPFMQETVKKQIL